MMIRLMRLARMARETMAGAMETAMVEVMENAMVEAMVEECLGINHPKLVMMLQNGLARIIEVQDLSLLSLWQILSHCILLARPDQTMSLNLFLVRPDHYQLETSSRLEH